MLDTDGHRFVAFYDGQTNALPDFTDPATLGCLLALVREAHGFYAHVYPLRNCSWEVSTPLVRDDNGIHAAPVWDGPSEAAALVAALEAAPKREVT